MSLFPLRKFLNKKETGTLDEFIVQKCQYFVGFLLAAVCTCFVHGVAKDGSVTVVVQVFLDDLLTVSLVPVCVCSTLGK